MAKVVFALLLSWLSALSASYYLPGVHPNFYQPGDAVALKANKVTSTKTPLQYEYYDLPFCKKGRGKSKADNLGERLSGDTVTTSPYELRMKQDEACVVLCRKKHKKADIEMFKQMIDAEYRVHWLLDNLPVAVRNDDLGYVSRGYPIGFLANGSKKSKSKHYLFNHVRIIVRYNEVAELPGVTIVGFEVVPFSIKHAYDAATPFNKDSTVLSTCNQFTPATFNPERFQAVETSDEEIVYTYDVKWEKSELPWTNRWDVYLKGNPDAGLLFFHDENGNKQLVQIDGPLIPTFI